MSPLRRVALAGLLAVLGGCASPVHPLPEDEVRVTLALPALAGATREDHVLRDPAHGTTIRRSQLRSENALAILQDVEIPEGQTFPSETPKVFLAGLLDQERPGTIEDGRTVAGMSGGAAVQGRTFRILPDGMSCVALQRFADLWPGDHRRSIFVLFCEERDTFLTSAEVEQVLTGLRVR